jgi:hypothetical protein
MAFIVFQWTVSNAFTSPVPCSVLKQKSTDGISTLYTTVSVAVLDPSAHACQRKMFGQTEQTNSQHETSDTLH